MATTTTTTPELVMDANDVEFTMILDSMHATLDNAINKPTEYKSPMPFQTAAFMFLKHQRQLKPAHQHDDLFLGHPRDSFLKYYDDEILQCEIGRASCRERV
eukprot:TRINITY_DN9648_c0_g1_i1.p2 TRINITY_DN9648_c0_g1~~TRINITY_DN9648_c0_g1_i1.p2  ORF type:complete len:102 (+),score=19.17 TRINITY_DN9648_c0_g1_i1:166-471(+)